MVSVDSSHARLQQQLDCQLEANPLETLKAWEKNGWNEEPGTDVDEAPLKYIALVILQAIENRIIRFTMEKDRGAILYGDTTETLPKAPPEIIARGLEIIREITDLEKPTGQSPLALGIRNDSIEMIVQKEGGLHVFNIPSIGV